MTEQKTKYPKPRMERLEGHNPNKISENEKYHKIVESHSTEATAVTKREKRIDDFVRPKKSESEKQIEQQSLLARIVKAVKRW